MKIEIKTCPVGFADECLWGCYQNGKPTHQFFVDYTKWSVTKIVRKYFGICK